MNINEEKAFIYSMMREITEERRKLTDIYYELKKRLDDLDRLEHRGVDELSLQGMIDLHNNKNTALAIANIQRESMMAIKKVQEGISHESLNTMIQQEVIKATHQHTQPQTQTQPEVVEQIEREQMRAIEKVKEDSKPKVESRIPRDEILKAREREIASKPKAFKQKKEVNKVVKFSKVSSIIASILKEAGKPVKASDLLDELNKRYDVEVTAKNFSNNIMFKIAKENPKVTRAMRGYYQYT